MLQVVCLHLPSKNPQIFPHSILSIHHSFGTIKNIFKMASAFILVSDFY